MLSGCVLLGGEITSLWRAAVSEVFSLEYGLWEMTLLSAKDSQPQHLWYRSHFQRVHLKREKFLREAESGGSGWRYLQSM